MKKNMCRGCEFLISREQIIFWRADGVTIRDPPLKKQKPFCSIYQLHIDSVERVIEGNEICYRYRDKIDE